MITKRQKVKKRKTPGEQKKDAEGFKAERDGNYTRLEGGSSTYSVTLRAWKASCTSFTRHSLKARGTLATGGSRGTSITLCDSR